MAIARRCGSPVFRLPSIGDPEYFRTQRFLCASEGPARKDSRNGVRDHVRKPPDNTFGDRTDAHTRRRHMYDLSAFTVTLVRLRGTVPISIQHDLTARRCWVPDFLLSIPRGIGR